jgi:DNA modification methylase
MIAQLHHGDCLEIMATLDANSIDAIVTDPPYGLSFMGKGWDHGVPGVEFWTEALRIARPGAHLLAFGGTRTYHRLAVAIEDAGWEIRDCVMWVYAQGFPKSHNFGCKCRAGAVPYTHEEAKPKTECEVRSVRDADVSPTVDSSQGRGKVLQSCVQESCTSIAGWEEFATAQIWEGQPSMEGGCNLLEKEGQLQIDQVCSLSGGVLANGEEGRLHNGTSIDYGAGNWALPDSNGGSPSSQPRSARQPTLQLGAVCKQRGAQTGGVASDQVCPICGGLKQWQGWGTALKPAYEPIIVARKPLRGTVAGNVLTHGTGGINVDGCRIPSFGESLNGGACIGSHGAHDGWRRPWMDDPEHNAASAEKAKARAAHAESLGRWPANLIHDGSDEVVGLFPQQTSGANPTRRNVAKFQNAYGEFAGQEECTAVRGADSGSAARFFYCAKASKRDRDEGCEGMPVVDCGTYAQDEWTRQNMGGFAQKRRNHHPTVKPTDLMRYLCRLVTPPGGVVLDPFMGSGSTGKAAILEGFRFIGIEREADYVKIARARIDAATPPLLQAMEGT